jgi:very-short-patch-repair endonuclease
MTSAELRILVKDSAMTDEQKQSIGMQLATPHQVMLHVRPQDAAIMALQESPLESKFLALWQSLDGPALEREFRFHDIRKFRFDFAHLASKTAIECEGGSYKGKGRHFSPTGFTNDAIKYNLATLAGWSVFRLPGQLVNMENIGPIVERTKRYA